ncbi:SAV_6107 family HEPN domain-containing protein [Actinomycetota bacterium]
MAALDLIERSEESLAEASRAQHSAERYLHAQLGALRAAAALVAARSDLGLAQDGPQSLWSLVPALAPELVEWADFFAWSTARRDRISQGRIRVTPREADDLLRQAETFVDLVAATLGMPHRSGRADLLAPTVAGEPGPGLAAGWA